MNLLIIHKFTATADLKLPGYYSGVEIIGSQIFCGKFL